MENLRDPRGLRGNLTHSTVILSKTNLHRMRPLTGAIAITVSLKAFLVAPSFGAAIHLAQGQMAGEITDSTVLLQTRLTATRGLDANGDVPGAEGVACFEWSQSPEFKGAARTPWQQAESDRDYIVRAGLSGLEPATIYYYRVIFGVRQNAARSGPAGRFKTLPGRKSRDAVRFCMGNCMNYHPFMTGTSNGGGRPTATEEDKRLGYPSFAAMNKLAPDFFIGAGDIVYYDKGPSFAVTLPAMRKKWHEQFRFPRLVEFFGRTPAYWMKDDHDFRFNDSDLSGAKKPLPDLGIVTFREQVPIHPQGDLQTPTYRTHRLNRDVQLWFTEGRDYRSPNRAPDGPEKSLWGREQREWLQRTLLESDATWKIIVTPTPMVGPDDASKRDNHTNPRGFRHEGEAFFAWLNAQSITNVLTFTGDRHWQFHSIHPSGVEEFSCGALNDENSRMGVKPGSPKGTDPEARIRQPWTYAEPTGGFLYVTVEPVGDRGSVLTIQFRDDRGAILHEVTKRWP
jgi:alkaline phosphatase D